MDLSTHNLIMFHFLVLNVVFCHEPSPGHTVNVSSVGQFADFVPGQHMPPSWYRTSADAASSQSRNRWGTQVAFSKTVYSFQVKEDTEPGTVVGKVSTVFDGRSPVAYSVQEDDGESLFLLSPLSGEFLVSRRLDFEEQRFYILTVSAQQGDLRVSSVRVYFNVLDVNDNPPVFGQDTFHASLREDTRVGTCFLSLNVSDKDDGDNGHIQLRVASGNEEGMFFITPAGSLCLNTPLDRERRSSFNLTVTASDCVLPVSSQLTSMARVLVLVDDVNDNAPVFVSSGSVTVPEDAALHSVVTTVRAEDRDAGLNGEVLYYLNNSSGGTFSIGEASGEIRLEEALDREREDTKTIRVMATDRGSPRMTSTMDLTVHVEDANDHDPEFPQSAYSLAVAEDVPRGSSVLRLQAHDRDAGGNGRVRYALTHAGPFAVDAVRGVVTVVGQLDREKRSNYTLVVTALDQGRAPRSAAATVSVVVLDVNDFAPVFAPETLVIHVLENESYLTQQVSALDEDSETNSQLTYFIERGNADGLFSITPNGTFQILQSLDREKESLYNITVIAVDSGSPSLTGALTVHVVVEDTNDNPPVFPGGVYNTIVSEDSPAGTVFAMITASDMDEGVSGEIRYFLENTDEPFAIEETSGELFTTDTLDRETAALYRLTVVGSDKHPTRPLSSSVLVTVLIGDINDHWPQFVNSPYVAYVPNEMAPGAVVCAVTATDGDAEMNADLRYSLYGQTSDLFAIDPYGGAVFASRALRRKDDVVVNVHVEDAGENPKFDIATLQVRFQDASGFPEMSVDVVTDTLSEDEPVGALVAVLAAASVRAEPVSFYLASGNSEDAFDLERLSGELRVERPLDYETRKEFTLLVEARDSGSPPFSSFAQIRLNISDVNDNLPQFTQAEYRCEVLENSPPSWVCDVLAVDADSGSYGVVQYNITEGNTENSFTIDFESGLISTTVSLDREYMSEFSLTVEAAEVDNPLHKDRATVIIVVLDRNDNPPRFSHIFQSRVPEDVPVGHSVLRVTSYDDDIGANAVISYSIIDQSADVPFNIDPTSGYVTVEGPLDREARDLYTLRVKANDSAWSVSTDVAVMVSDVNDNRPVFSGDFTTVLAETTEKEVFVVRVVATDVDLGPNSEILYLMDPLNEEFWVNASTGDVYTKRLLTLFNYPFEVYQFTILAFDCGIAPLHSNATVTVRLVPYNHYPPTFLPSPSLVVIPYLMAVGTEVFQLTALDQDVGNGSASIEYALSGGNASDFFWIQADSGRIFLNQTLAASINMFLSFTVVAKDRGAPPLSSHTEITVEITGQNQFPPSFREPDVTFSVPEDLPIGSVIGKIQAEDLDQGANGAIVYSINPENPNVPFSIGAATGLLTLITELDYEIQDIYQLQIQATDGGWAPRSGLLNVTVSVMDVNDNPPVFPSSEYLTSLPENSEAGTNVLTVTAADADSGANSRIFYSLIAGHVDKFAIDARNGAISTLGVFDYEREQVFDVTVRASNKGRQTLFSLAHVVIHISDVNEFTPTFTDKEFSFSVFKNVPVGTRIGKVTAVDYDQGSEGQVFYLMFGQNKHVGFGVEELSGEIYTTGSLRKQGNNNVLLRVLAKNSGVIAGPDVDEAVVHVSVIDTNDAPVFTSALYEVNVTEDSPAGTSLLTVSARDQDSILEWNRFFYGIENGNSNSAFAVDPSSGVLSVNSPLDRELYPVYNLTLTATDNGSPPATGTSTVIVAIGDVNDNAPTLAFTEAQLKENQPQGTIVARLNAFDGDSPLNQGPFTFWLVNPLTESPFVLTPDGVLFTTRPTDREHMSTYRLLVAVRDAGIPPLSSTTMFHIAIVDENDNPSLPRNIFIEVKYFGSSFQGGMIGNVRPDDQDESDSFACTIKSGPTNMFIIPNGTCELWSSPFQGEATFNITIEATDHLHYPVNNSIYINYKGFTNASIDNCILFYVSSPSMQEFLSKKYLKFVKALDSLFNLQASKTHVFGIKHIGREILLLAAVKTYNGEYLSKDVASGISSGHKKLLEAQSNVTISHITSDPCLTGPCQNGAACNKNIFISQSVAVLESLAVIYVSPQKELFNCTCPGGFAGTLCQDDVDECESSPCENEGTCVNVAGSFHCHCQSGFSGSVCAVDGDECLMLRCQNGGTCIPTQDGYDCRCMPGFEGEMCEQLTDHCTSSPCGQGSCINSQTGFACQCPFGVSGGHCEEHSYGFEELSFMEFPPLDRRINFISVEFATVQRNSLLLYNPGGSAGSREYMALEILEGAVQLSYDLGSGPVTLRTSKQVADGHFHSVTLRRIGNMGSVHVDNCTDAENSGVCFSQNHGSSSSERTLDVGNSNMTFGGVRTVELILLQPPPVKSHDFVGCVRNLHVNGILLRPAAALSTFNILDRCPRTAASPCHNNPCKNGGVCLDLWSHYHCECKGPFTGSNCAIATSEELVLRFNGNEYVEYFVKERFRRDHQLKNHENEENTEEQTLINIKFKTKDGGVLVFVLTQMGHFMLDVKDGKLVYVCRDSLSGHTSESAVDSPVADGLWHVLLIVSDGQSTLLLLDDDPVLNVTRQTMDFTPLTVDKIVVGAAVTADSKLPRSGFVGCVQHFSATSSTLLVSEHSVMVDVWPSPTLLRYSCRSSGVCVPSPCAERGPAWRDCLSTHCQNQCGPAVQNHSCICLHNVSDHVCDMCGSAAENPDWCHTVQDGSLWLVAVILPLMLVIVGVCVVLYRVRRLRARCWGHGLPQKSQHGADNAAFRFDSGGAVTDPAPDPQRFSVSEFYCDVNVSGVQFVPNFELEYYDIGSISSTFQSDSASLKLSLHHTRDHKQWGDLNMLLAGFEEECVGEEQAKPPARPQRAPSLYKQAFTKVGAAKSLRAPFYTKRFLQPEHVQCLTFREISKLNVPLEQASVTPAPVTRVPSGSESTCSESECRRLSKPSPSAAEQQKTERIPSRMFAEWDTTLNMNLPFSSYAPVFEEIARLPLGPGCDVKSDAEEII